MSQLEFYTQFCLHSAHWTHGKIKEITRLLALSIIFMQGGTFISGAHQRTYNVSSLAIMNREHYHVYDYSDALPIRRCCSRTPSVTHGPVTLTVQIPWIDATRESRFGSKLINQSNRSEVFCFIFWGRIPPFASL